jgi:hypothetical protein
MPTTSPFPAEVSSQAGLDYLVSHMQAAVVAYKKDPDASDSREKYIWWVTNFNQEMVYIYFIISVYLSAKI